MHWHFHKFHSLDTHLLFALMKLRVDVFVVEQNCAYPELDSYDTHPETLHLLGYDNDQLVAYARAMPTSSVVQGKQQVRIGRVVVAPAHRGKGIARDLMQQLLERLVNDYPDHDQILAAQVSVQELYAHLGFKAESAIYLEDGIEHIDMRRLV